MAFLVCVMESVARLVVPKSGKIAEKEGKKEGKNEREGEREERASYLRSLSKHSVRLSQDTSVKSPLPSPMNQKFTVSRELSRRDRRDLFPSPYRFPAKEDVLVADSRESSGRARTSHFFCRTRASMQRILRFISAAK